MPAGDSDHEGRCDHYDDADGDGNDDAVGDDGEGREGRITLVNRIGTAQLIPGHKAVGEKGQGGQEGVGGRGVVKLYNKSSSNNNNRRSFPPFVSVLASVKVLPF